MIVINTTKVNKPKKKKFILSHLYAQVLLAIILGVLLGYFYPQTGVEMKILGDGFIRLIKMLIGPIIFCTVVVGIASMDNMRSAGRVAVKALSYFLIISTLSLVIGLVVANIGQPGVGMNVDGQALDPKAAEKALAGKQKLESFHDFALHIIPTTFVSAFTEGEILQVLFIALLFAAAAIAMGDPAKPLIKLIENFSHILFGIVGIVMKIAPIGAFGAMAYTIGEFGLDSLIPLGKLLIGFYITCILFVVIILGGIMKIIGLNVFQFIKYIKEELLIVLGTCSSETVFPRMVDKLTALGCKPSVVGMVLPTGYSFNLDGTAIYLTLAAIFLAQATNTPFGLEQQIALLAIMMLTSKGAAGVVGSAFIVLSATINSVGHIPVASVALLLGIDRFMAEGRSVTNLIGNGVATLFVAKWENSLDTEKAKKILSGKVEARLETSV
jgi:aerobic C4-dicarboxylate transport protein